ncbi:MAG: MbcA/ParS/Xre antitoxin family protein [Burkholderiaceae bacterium]|nr:MbcA/ParS/Xre antitoxin family protein [Burkholderiaceae bacterium]
MDFLNADASPSISPKRFGLVFRVDMQTLAAQARVHRNTLRLAPDTETLQAHLRESLRVIRAAADVSGSVEKALFWFKNHPLPVFDYKTPQDLVSEKRTEALIKYLQSLRAGYAG